MTKQVALSIGLIALFAITISQFSSVGFNGQVNAEQQSSQSANVVNQAAGSFVYGRLVFAEDQKYNWIVGDEQVQRPATAQSLIRRLGGNAKRPNFASLLNTIGQNGWELVFETEDPEGYGDVLVFKKTLR